MINDLFIVMTAGSLMGFFLSASICLIGYVINKLINIIK